MIAPRERETAEVKLLDSAKAIAISGMTRRARAIFSSRLSVAPDRHVSRQRDSSVQPRVELKGCPVKGIVEFLAPKQ
jgi:hypothetical protein